MPLSALMPAPLSTTILFMLPGNEAKGFYFLDKMHPYYTLAQHQRTAICLVAADHLSFLFPVSQPQDKMPVCPGNGPEIAKSALEQEPVCGNVIKQQAHNEHPQHFPRRQVFQQ